MSRRPAILACAALASAAVVAGCGSSDSGGGSGGSSGGGGSTPSVSGAKTIDVNSMSGAKGTVNYCSGKDTSGGQILSVKQFNQKYASQGLKAKLIEFPTSADEQRNQFIQREQAKSADCDVFFSDVIWTVEFAGQKWLYDLTPYVQKRQSEFIPSTLATNKYAGKFWGVPQATDAAFLYYRTDQVKTPPQTWQEVYKAAQQLHGIVYAGAPYEGTTCTFLELAFANGGDVLSSDGKKSVVGSAQNVKALQFMVDGVKSGAAPKAIITFMEEPTRLAYETGKYTFERQWPYAYALGNKAPKIKGKFKVAPLPSFEGGSGAGQVLGGHNLVISAYSKNAGGALKLLDFLTSEQIEKQNAAKFSLAPVLNATYDDPAVKKALPFSDQLKTAVENAKSRPVSPVYPQISQAIFKNVNDALAGRVTPQAALQKAQSEMDKALTTF